MKRENALKLPEIKYFIYIHDTRAEPFTQWIMSGKKCLETRGRDTLASLIWQRVAIVRTRSHKQPEIVGFCTIMPAYRVTNPLVWDLCRDLHHVQPGSRYDWTSKTTCKYLYTLSDVSPCNPHPLPETAHRINRSYGTF